jgi:tetratricopeptide (TPR) repeat protein
LIYNREWVCYKNLCQHQRGIKNFNTVIRLKPDYAGTYNNAGTVYLIMATTSCAAMMHKKRVIL